MSPLHMECLHDSRELFALEQRERLGSEEMQACGMVKGPALKMLSILGSPKMSRKCMESVRPVGILSFKLSD